MLGREEKRRSAGGGPHSKGRETQKRLADSPGHDISCLYGRGGELVTPVRGYYGAGGGELGKMEEHRFAQEV